MHKLENPQAATPEICVSRKTVRLAQREIKLPDLSFRLLRLLSERAPDPVAFDEIERVVWVAQVTRETIKQRVKLLRESLAGLGVADGGVDSVRNVGYRLAETFGTYEPQTGAKPGLNMRRIWVAVIGLAVCVCAILVHLFASGERVPGNQLSVAIDSEAPAVVGAFPASAWKAAHQSLIKELSRMPGLEVFTDRQGKQSADVVVAMESIADGPYETVSLKLVETRTGTLLWAETFDLDQDGYEKPVSIFAADARRQMDALGLHADRTISADQRRRSWQLYSSAASLAKSGTEQDLLAAKARVDASLAMRPGFALAQSLGLRIDAALVADHGRNQGLATQALEQAQSLVDLHPDVPEFQRTLAAVQIARGDLPEALANLEKAQRHQPFLRPETMALQRQVSGGLP